MRRYFQRLQLLPSFSILFWPRDLIQVQEHVELFDKINRKISTATENHFLR